MPTDIIRYDLLVQEALRSVVRKVLGDAARDGLPGEHHFFITFRTDMPGVKIADHVLAKHPEEITIALQHQFWDMRVGDNFFEVGLSFGGVPERGQVGFKDGHGARKSGTALGCPVGAYACGREGSHGGASPRGCRERSGTFDGPNLCTAVPGAPKVHFPRQPTATPWGNRAS